MFTGPHIELGTMQRTGQQSATKSTFGKFGIAMRTVVGHRIESSSQSTEHYPVLTEFWEHSHLPVTEISQIAKFNHC
jgi:hypothetical protein